MPKWVEGLEPRILHRAPGKCFSVLYEDFKDRIGSEPAGF